MIFFVCVEFFRLRDFIKIYVLDEYPKKNYCVIYGNKLFKWEGYYIYARIYSTFSDILKFSLILIS